MKPWLHAQEYVFSKVYDDGVIVNTSFLGGQFTIYSIKGEELYVGNFAENHFFWDGKDAKGNPLGEGYYPCLIKNQSGGILKTSVTISP